MRQIPQQFRSNFGLCLHPEPLMEGHYLLFEPLLKPGQLPEDPSDLYLQDYSRITRGRFNSFKFLRRSSEQSDPKVEGVYQDTLDIYRCFTSVDMQVLVKIISKVDGIALLNILPQDQKSFLPMSNGHINIVLRKFAILQKQNRKLLPFLADQKRNCKPCQMEFKELLPLEEFIINQKSKCYSVGKNVFKLKGLDIIHFISFPEKMLTAEQSLENVTNLLSAFLEKDPNAPLKMGFNLVFSKYILFMYPTFTNYSSINGVDVHLPVLAPLGFLNLPLDKNCSQNTMVNIFELIKLCQRGNKKS